jgi:hypothetical protein
MDIDTCTFSAMLLTVFEQLLKIFIGLLLVEHIILKGTVIPALPLYNHSASCPKGNLQYSLDIIRSVPGALLALPRKFARTSGLISLWQDTFLFIFLEAAQFYIYYIKNENAPKIFLSLPMLFG